MIKVLLIEDNEDHATLIIGTIKTAYNGDVKIIHEQKLASAYDQISKVNVVITDLNLPSSEGFETVSSLISKMPHTIPLIVLTTKDDYELGEKAVTLGAQDYLVKGIFPPQSLRRCIEFSIIRKKYEHSINKEKDFASHQANLKSSLLANMSHEIRTPLNSIIGLSSFLLSDFDELETPELKSAVETINNSSNLLLSLINEILDFSKLEAGEVKLIPQNTNLINFLESTKKIMDHSIIERGNVLEIKIDGEIPVHVILDVERTRQIILNFLNNANKFTKYGLITLSARLDKNNSNKIIFSVKDTGIGISQKKADLIFEPFKQADKDTFRKFGGTGLGLSICKKLVSVMQGEIGVDSEKGKGSNFYFSIPLIAGTRREDCDEEDVKYEDQFLNLSNLKKTLEILSVDDSRDNQNLIKVYLRKYNINLTFAYDGREAIEKYKENQYDLILMDMQMPILNGYEATFEIRRYERNQKKKEVPIVALTAAVMKEELDMSYKVGCNDYISKPIKKNDLAFIINKNIDFKTEVIEKKNEEIVLNAKILVIDDNVQILDIMRKQLESPDWDIVTTNSAFTALDLMRDEKFDVVITDYLMPEMNGYEVFKESVEKGYVGPDSFLFTSGFSEEISNRLTDHNCKNKVFVKPYDLRELKREIRQIISN